MPQKTENNKFLMLNEFKSQLYSLFDSYSSNLIDYELFNSKLNRLMVSWSLSRIDIKNHSSKSGDVLFETYNDDIRKITPSWFSDKEGIGYSLTTNHTTEFLTLKCIQKGTLTLSFKGVDYRDLNKERVPIYVEYVNIILNEENLLKEKKMLWHDAPKVFKVKCNKGDVFNLTIDYNTIFDYFPILKKYLTDIDENNIKQRYDLIKGAINEELDTSENNSEETYLLDLLDGDDFKEKMSYKFESDAKSFDIIFEVSNILKRYYPQVGICAREGITVMYKPQSSKHWKNLDSFYLESKITVDMSKYVNEGEKYEIMIYSPIIGKLTKLHIVSDNPLKKVTSASSCNIVVAGGPISYGMGCTNVKNMFSNILERKFDARVSHISYNQQNYLKYILNYYNNNSPPVTDVGILELDYFMQKESCVEELLPEVITIMKQRCKYLVGWYVIPESKTFKKIIANNTIKEYIYNEDLQIFDFSYLYNEKYNDLCVYNDYYINDTANILIYKKFEKILRGLMKWNI